MPIEPVKIPQNVHVEDRIIGPITLKQMMIVMISAGISYALWASMKMAGPISTAQTAIAWTPTVIGILFAFVKINNMSMLRIVFLTIERMYKPAKRIWTPRQGIYINIVTNASTKKKNDQPAPVVQSHAHRMEELSHVLDQGPPEEVNAADDVKEVAEYSSEPIRKPVRPERVKADLQGKPVDDIQNSNQKNARGMPGNILRDISPPPSHA